MIAVHISSIQLIRVPWWPGSWGYAAAFANGAGRFAVPLFFVITAISLAAAGEVKSWRGFAGRKLKQILPPYLIYSLSYYLAFVVAGKRVWSAGDFGEAMLFGGAAGHLWFMHVLVVLIVLHPLLYRIYRRTLQGKPGIVLALGVIQLAYDVMATMTTDPILGRSTGVVSAILGLDALKHIWFFLAGYMVYDYADVVMIRLQRPLWVLQAALVTLAAAQVQTTFWVTYIPASGGLANLPYSHVLTYLTGPLEALGMLVILLKIHSTTDARSWWRRLLASFGLFSMGVYYLHIFVGSGLKYLALLPLQATAVTPPTVPPSWLLPLFLVTSLLTLTAVRYLSRTPLRRLFL